MFGNLFERPSALIVIVLLAIVVFGWKRLPDAARSLGRSARILKSEIGEMQEEGKKSDAANTTVPGETVPPQPASAVPGEAPVQQPPAQTYPQQPPAQAYPQQPPAQTYPQQPTGTNSDRPTGA